jgi:hypothetical protein
MFFTANDGVHGEELWVAEAAAALDIDCDGIFDEIEGTDDFDGDTIPNYLDPDSDNDGIDDADEGSDDIDLDGSPNFIDLDSDDDGLCDRSEHIFGSDPYDSNDIANVPMAPAATLLLAALMLVLAARYLRPRKARS